MHCLQFKFAFLLQNTIYKIDMTIEELKAKAEEIVESIKDKGVYWKENTLYRL